MEPPAPEGDDEAPMVFDAGHMLERIGLFIMLCFGEAVTQIVTALAAEPTPARWVVGGLGFVLVCCLFWMFYDVALDRVEHALEGAPDRLRDFLGFGQLSVVAGVLGVAAGVSNGIEHASGDLTAGGVRVLAGGVALVSLGVLSLSMESLKAIVATRGAFPEPPPRPHRDADARAARAAEVAGVAGVAEDGVVGVAGVAGVAEDGVVTDAEWPGPAGPAGRDGARPAPPGLPSAGVVNALGERRRRRFERRAARRGMPRRGGRLPVMLALAAQVVQAVAMPVLVIALGTRLTPWLAIALLAASPLSFALLGAMTRGRGGMPTPGSATAAA